ncbi:serine hydrolase [Chryseobacterium sp. Leaf405]|uniref:serine hydrolase n=1 Tax=Chryseobacterium sp. Leaf405 TaxID=1736367 RepID=UPI0009E6DB41|nr:serine hydrolase [Chryseobacterium sp. Leaf405]
MKNFLYITLFLLATSFSQHLSGQSPSDSIDLFIKEKMTQLKIPGLQLAIVKNGKLEKLSHYGLANIEHNVPTSSKSTFSINSMTKAFVGVAIMQLQEQEKLKVDDQISQYIGDIPNEWRVITLRQLLGNISGLPNNINEKEQVIGDGTEENNWEMVKKLPMEFKPGERFSYNQTGYYILGRIITKLSGQHFTKFIEENQFKVADMGFTQSGDSNDIIPNNAGAYSTIVNVDGKWINDGKLHNAFASFPIFFRTATGIISNSDDLAKWLIALQNGKLLRNKTSVTELFTSVKLNDGHIDGFNKLTNGYALGWPTVVRDEHPAAAPVGGMRSALFVYPNDELSIVILTNLQGSNPEWFIDEIAGFYFSDMKIKNGFGLTKNLKQLRQQLIRSKFKNSLNIYSDIKRRNKDYHLSEDEINSWGYQLLEQNKKNEALEVFQFNTLLYPKSANVYDSYAETLELTGNRKEAIINYRKSLELNPANSNARQFLENKK